MSAPVLSDADLRAAGYLPMCPDAICDGEEHYSGYRDRETNEDIVTGPCPRWQPADAGSARLAVVLAAALIGPLLGLAFGALVLALQPVVCAINGTDGPRYCQPTATDHQEPRP